MAQCFASATLAPFLTNIFKMIFDYFGDYLGTCGPIESYFIRKFKHKLRICILGLKVNC